MTIISFKTKNGKIATLSKDKNNGYLVYRLGTEDKIELEYPEKNETSWEKFTFSFYHRGGGEENSAMDLNNVWFTIDGYEYSIFTAYRIKSKYNPESFDVGVKVTNLQTEKEIRILATKKSVKGSLQEFRENGLLKINDDRID